MSSRPARPTRPAARTLPAWALIVVPAVSWTALLCITVGLSADGTTPVGGLFAVSIALVSTVTACCLVLWMRADFRAHTASESTEVRTHVSAEFASFYAMIGARIDRMEIPTQPILRVVATASVPVPAAEALPDNVRSFELGRQLGRREHDTD